MPTQPLLDNQPLTHPPPRPGRLDSKRDVTLAEGRWRSSTQTVLVGMLALAVGVAAGAAAMIQIRTTDGPTDEVGASTFPVVLEPYGDERRVEAQISVNDAPTLHLAAAGVLTSTACSPGATLKSGRVLGAVDGKPVLLLSTSVPFWRDLGSGVSGADVRALQEELTRLGHAVDATGTWTASTTTVLRALRRSLDLPETPTGLRLTDLAWLPNATGPVRSCDTGLGERVEPGSPFLTFAPSIVSLRVQLMPEDLIDGPRVFTVDEVALGIDASGVVAVADRASELAQTPTVAAALQAAEGGTPIAVPGQLTLAEPVEAATLPASAVVSSGAQFCVFDPEGEALPVVVLASALGRSIVSFTADQPGAVAVTPPEASSCA